MYAGGYNVRQLDPVWFRKHVGLVNQEPVLFANSIADNISYGKENATASEVCTYVHKVMVTNVFAKVLHIRMNRCVHNYAHSHSEWFVI